MFTQLLGILLPLALLFHVTSQFKVPNSDNYSSVYPFLAKCANASKTGLLTVVFDDFDDSSVFDVPPELLRRLNVTARLLTIRHIISVKQEHGKRENRSREAEGCVLVLFSNTDHLRDILSSPHLVAFWHPENVYILQETVQESSDMFERERFCRWAFERLWKFRRVYRVIFFSDDKAIRYDPFEYAGSHVRNVQNTSCDWFCVTANKEDFLMIDFPNSTDISDFFDEDRRSFGLYPLKISIFESASMLKKGDSYEGIDYLYLEEVTRNMNVTPVLVPTKDLYGWEDNGVFFGTIGHLVQGYADVSFNQFFIKDYSTRLVESTTAITSDKLCVLVPKAPPVPDYLVIVKTFSGGTWLLVFAGHFTITTIYTCLMNKKRSVRGSENDPWTMKMERDASGVRPVEPKRNFGTRDEHSKQLKQASLICLASLTKYLAKVVLQLVQPFSHSQPWFPERLLLMCSLWLSLILNGVFTSQLASTFSKRLYYDDIDTLEELEETGMPIFTNARDVIEDALSDSTSPLIQRLHKRLKLANLTEIHRRLFETKDAGYLHPPRTLPFQFDEYQRKKLHLVKECPKEYILALIMTKGSPFRKRINSILGRLNNGGFYDKWYSGMVQPKKWSHVTDESNGHRKIAMRHLFIPFAILYVGLAASAFVFVCERRKSNLR
ncbi:uncharacterized protein LOC128892752 [Hylaeus anthracinus]|uniref:uncharacterized protein LOC128892752 n=1 Tax=Hylaeus anthracinus TaxID=313031 RepID=UPI0023B898EF|nr:uncharacterized protein LOC128892752 [Hylaeus anthracinus]